MNTNQKRLANMALIILIVIIAAGATGYLYWYKKAITSTDWKTYANEKYWYQISVPKNWTPEGGIDPTQDTHHVGFFNSESGVQIDTTFDPNCQDFQSCVHSHRMVYNAAGQTADNLSFVIVGRNKAAVESFTFNEIEDKTYYFYKNQTIYQIWFRTSGQEKSTISPIFEQIISTFKFTK